MPSNCGNQNIWRHHQCSLERGYRTKQLYGSGLSPERPACALTPQDPTSPTSDSFCTLFWSLSGMGIPVSSASPLSQWAFSQSSVHYSSLRSRYLAKPPTDSQSAFWSLNRRGGTIKDSSNALPALYHADLTLLSFRNQCGIAVEQNCPPVVLESSPSRFRPPQQS